MAAADRAEGGQVEPVLARVLILKPTCLVVLVSTELHF